MEKKGNPKQRSVRRPTQPLGDRATRDSFKIDDVLVPLDFSRSSFKALEYARPLAERFDAKLHLVHAFDYDYSMSTFSAMPLAIPETDLIVTATHGSTGLTHVLLGSTAEHVVRYAHCPVLVMPSYKRGGNAND